jgi:gas vesicle protein
MYYDDTTRRVNVVTGLAIGAVLGAGIALLLLPEDRLKSGGRIVVRAARTLGRTIEDEADEPVLSPARERAKKLARRRFKL